MIFQPTAIHLYIFQLGPAVTKRVCSGRNITVSDLNLKTNVTRAAMHYLCVGLAPKTRKNSVRYQADRHWQEVQNGPFREARSPGSQTAGRRAEFWACGPGLSSSPTESSCTPWYGRTRTLRSSSKHCFSLTRLVSKMKRNELCDKGARCSGSGQE